MKLKGTNQPQHQKSRDMARLKDEAIGMAYRERLEEKLRRANAKESDINERVENLVNAIAEAYDETVPEEERIKKKWITPETIKLVKEKRILKPHREESENAERDYRRKCNEVRKAARADKARWLEGQCRNIEQYYGEHKAREVYKMIRDINRRWQPKPKAIKDEQGNVLMENSEILQRWTNYCSDLYMAKLDKNIEEELIEELKEISPPLIDRSDDILKEEVETAVKRLKNNKSPGNDKITGEMIKAGGEMVIKELHEICNTIWKEGKAPGEWKKSILVVLHKKGSALECGNYRTIALISHLGKVLMMILKERLRTQMEEHLADEQAGFRKDRNTVQQILALKLIAEGARRKDIKIYNCFVDFQKAFDSVDQKITWAVLNSYGVDKRITRLLQDINENAEAAVRIQGELGRWFGTNRGTRQGDPISPSTFISHLERAMDKIRGEDVAGVSVHGTRINSLIFADDIDIIETDELELEKTVQELNKEAMRYGLKMNLDKTKTMVFGSQNMVKRISVDGVEIEIVEKFTYLGSTMTYDLDARKEIYTRMAKATSNLKAMDKIWKSKEITLQTKLSILKTCVFSCMLYGCETWTILKEVKRRILAFERTCYRKILRVSWTQKMTNEELYARICPKENLMQAVIQRKLRLFGHICRMKDNRKLKMLVFGQLEGKNRRGRPHREWTDDITNWCETDLHTLFQSAQNRQEWEEIVHRAADTNGQ